MLQQELVARDQRQFLEFILNADWTKVLPTVNQVMQQDQTGFWQSWQPLQQRYLSSNFRHSLRSLLIMPTHANVIS
ncbi:MAG TPA: hypothetical protein V6C84_19750 [Coleofasciculaceae cyanobacterium]|jgi:CHAD domain-containing protein